MEAWPSGRSDRGLAFFICGAARCCFCEGGAWPCGECGISYRMVRFDCRFGGYPHPHKRGRIGLTRQKVRMLLRVCSSTSCNRAQGVRSVAAENGRKAVRRSGHAARLGNQAASTDQEEHGRDRESSSDSYLLVSSSECNRSMLAFRDLQGQSDNICS